MNYSKSRPIDKKKLIIYMVAPLLLGMIITVFSGSVGNVYRTLVLPSIAPPAFVYPIVWTVLYLLMGLSAYIITTSGNRHSPQAMTLYYAQLILNLAWPICFFYLHMYSFSAVLLLCIVIMVLVTMMKFFSISTLAGRLFIPYFLWVCFALYLNIFIAIYN